jgi:hypothetical protein
VVVGGREAAGEEEKKKEDGGESSLGEKLDGMKLDNEESSAMVINEEGLRMLGKEMSEYMQKVTKENKRINEYVLDTLK